MEKVRTMENVPAVENVFNMENVLYQTKSQDISSTFL